METNISDPELKCPVCEHKSVSIKSLYGHMRNHPDRNWRGMKPPIPGIKNNIFTSLTASGLGSDGDTRPGSGLIFPQWSKTSRRTRTRPGKAQMIIPASNQALLSPDNEKSSRLIKTRLEKSRIYVPASNQALPGCPDSISCNFFVPENVERVTDNLPPKKRRMKPGLSLNARNSNPGPESSKKERDFILDDNIGCKNPIRARGSHVCDVCDRAFKSYQALGGHKSHHNNNKAHDIMSMGGDNESSTTVVVYGEWAEGEGRCCVVVHRCPFCDRVFSKGQALGGHKRHCRRKMCSGGGQETGSGRFSFDLNELPPESVPEGTDVACGWSVAYK